MSSSSAISTASSIDNSSGNSAVDVDMASSTTRTFYQEKTTVTGRRLPASNRERRDDSRVLFETVQRTERVIIETHRTPPPCMIIPRDNEASQGNGPTQGNGGPQGPNQANYSSPAPANIAGNPQSNAAATNTGRNPQSNSAANSGGRAAVTGSGASQLSGGGSGPTRTASIGPSRSSRNGTNRRFDDRAYVGRAPSVRSLSGTSGDGNATNLRRSPRHQGPNNAPARNTSTGSNSTPGGHRVETVPGFPPYAQQTPSQRSISRLVAMAPIFYARRRRSNNNQAPDNQASAPSAPEQSTRAPGSYVEEVDGVGNHRCIYLSSDEEGDNNGQTSTTPLAPIITVESSDEEHGYPLTNPPPAYEI